MTNYGARSEAQTGTGQQDQDKGTVQDNGRDGSAYERLLDQDTNGAGVDKDEPQDSGTTGDAGRGKGVASAETNSAEATRNQPVASTIGVSPNNTTPDDDPAATVQGYIMEPQDTHRLSPKSRGYNRVIVIGFAAAGLFAFYISFYAIMSFAESVGFPRAVSWAFPAFIDTMIIISAGAILSQKAHGTRTWRAWLALLTFSAASVFANVMHALRLDNDDQLWAVGAAVLAALVPIGVFAATELVGDIAIDNPQSRRRERAETAEAEDEALERKRRRELAEAEHQVELARLTKTSEAEIKAEVRSLEQAPAKADTQDKGTGESRTKTGAVARSSRGQGAPASRSKTGQASIGDVAAFIQARTEQGQDSDKNDVAEEFGCSPKTGYRRLRELQVTSPHIFINGGDQA